MAENVNSFQLQDRASDWSFLTLTWNFVEEYENFLEHSSRGVQFNCWFYICEWYLLTIYMIDWFAVFYKFLTALNLLIALPFYNKGPRILHFGSPQTYANTFMRSMWPATTKSGVEPMAMSYDQQSLLYSFANVQHQQDKQLPVFQANGYEAMSGIPMSQPISSTTAPSACGKGRRKLSSDGKPGSFDPGCALYLLSTLQTQSSELSLVQSTITCPMQSSPLGNVHFDAGDKYSCSESPRGRPIDQEILADASTTNLHCNGMLRRKPDGLVQNVDSPTLPFFWE